MFVWDIEGKNELMDKGFLILTIGDIEKMDNDA